MTEKQKLAADNIALAHIVANKFKNTGIEFEELKSLAYVGLVKAAKTFDPAKGYQFSTLAVKIMNNEILMFLRNNKKHSIPMMALDKEIVEDCTLKDIIPSIREDDRFAEVEWKLNFASNWKYLDKTEQKVLKARIDNPELTQMELSEMIGMSQSYISRVLLSAKKKIFN